MAILDGFPAVSGVADQWDVRAGLRAMVAQDAPGNIKTGLVATTASLAGVVTSRTDMQVDVAAFEAAHQDAGPSGHRMVRVLRLHDHDHKGGNVINL